MRIRGAVIATALVITLSAGCSSAQVGLGPSWPQLLETIEKGAPDQNFAQVKSFKERFGVGNKEKQEAAYILGRMLQANPQLSVATSASDGTKSGGGIADAVNYFEEASGLASLRERAQLHAVECATAANDEQLLRKVLQEQIADPGIKDAVRKAGLAYSLAQSYLRTQETDSAFSLFSKIRTEAPDSNFAYGSGYYLADAALNGQNSGVSPAEAIELFRAYIRKNPDGKFAREIVSKMKDLSSREGATYTPSAADHELWGQVYHVSGDSTNALAEFKRGPANAHVTQKVMCLFRLGRGQEARDLLLQGIAQSPALNYANVADLISQPLTREQTRTFWQQVLAAKPQKADIALWNIAIRSEPAEGANYYRRVISEYPTSEFAPESCWWLFWNYAKQAPKNASMIGNALAVAHEGIAKYPETRAGERLGFWTGKMYELQHKPAQAAAAYRALAERVPSSYYAHRAMFLLAVIGPQAGAASNSASTSAARPKAKDLGFATFPDRRDARSEWSWPAPGEIMSAKSLSEKYGATVSELFKLRQLDECVEVLPAEVSPEFKSALLARIGKPLSAINAAKKGLSGEPRLNAHWQLCYPLEYAATVKAEATAKRVDPYLAHALIREESHYYHRALSRSKAIGLMQLLPGTAYGVAKRLGVQVQSQDDFFQPAINIKLGTDYLSYVLGRYSGNALMAVASYNGGPNAVKTWLARHEQTGIGDYDYFVENIPVRETRDYVRKVFGSYWNYLSIYGAYPMKVAKS